MTSPGVLGFEGFAKERTGLISVLFSCGTFASALKLILHRGKKREKGHINQGFPILSVAVIPLMELFVSKIKINVWMLPFSLLLNSLEMLTICRSDGRLVKVSRKLFQPFWSRRPARF